MYRYYRILCITTNGEHQLSPYSVWTYNAYSNHWGSNRIAVIIPNKL